MRADPERGTTRNEVLRTPSGREYASRLVTAGTQGTRRGAATVCQMREQKERFDIAPCFLLHNSPLHDAVSYRGTGDEEFFYQGNLTFSLSDPRRWGDSHVPDGIRNHHVLFYEAPLPPRLRKAIEGLSEHATDDPRAALSVAMNTGLYRGHALYCCENAPVTQKAIEELVECGKDAARIARERPNEKPPKNTDEFRVLFYGPSEEWREECKLTIFPNYRTQAAILFPGENAAWRTSHFPSRKNMEKGACRMLSPTRALRASASTEAWLHLVRDAVQRSHRGELPQKHQLGLSVGWESVALGWELYRAGLSFADVEPFMDYAQSLPKRVPENIADAFLPSRELLERERLALERAKSA